MLDTVKHVYKDIKSTIGTNKMCRLFTQVVFICRFNNI